MLGSVPDNPTDSKEAPAGMQGARKGEAEEGRKTQTR